MKKTHKDLLFDTALKLYKAGFNIVPIRNEGKIKRPISPTWSSRKRISEEELRSLLPLATGIAIAGGPENPFKPTAIVFLIDVDKPEEVKKVYPYLYSKVEEARAFKWFTGPRCPKCEEKNLDVIEYGKVFRCPKCNIEFTIEEAKRGIGVLASMDLDTYKKHFEKKGKGTIRKEPLVEILINNYQLIPPSLHPTGVRYEWISPPDFEAANYGIIPLEEYDIKRILGELGELEEEKEREETLRKALARRDLPPRELSEDQIKKIVNLLSPYYVRKHRDLIIFDLMGILIRYNYALKGAYRIVELLASLHNDEEYESRIKVVLQQYTDAVKRKPLHKFTSVNSLKKELEQVLRERGLPDDEVTKKVSETIAELIVILKGERCPGVAWLERKGSFFRKWIAVGRQGIYLFRRREEKEEPTVQIISNAIIRDVKAIRVLGLDLKNLYAVDIDGEEIIGTVDEIVAHIEKHYGLERGSKYALARLIAYSAEEGEELYYSPGPWVVDGRIIFAREPGYTPPWKQYITWTPVERNDGELVKEALKSIRYLVLSYKDPGRASLVLSYAAISPIMHFIKKVLNIAPHLVIHGLEGTGKSVLLELVKLLYNITWEDTFPGSDYQARKCLATSTLPAIIDEIGSIIEGYAKEKRNAMEAINVLHRATTQEVMRVSGGFTYGGYFLAVRTLMATTNTDISLVPWHLDKFILVSISVKERIDVEKAKGYTPRTMRGEVKSALPSVGIELLREVEKLLPKIEELKELPREEIREKLIELGYLAWVELYKKYGLEPFPEPSKPETELEKASMSAQYEDIFRSYVIRGIEKGEKGIPELIIYEEEDLERIGESVLAALNKNLAVIIRHKDGREELLCKTAYLSKFKEWAQREFGLIAPGWRRLAEILDMKITMRKIGEKTLRNILVKDISVI